MTARPPYIISWNVTKRCNLSCVHCYLDACELEGASDIPEKAALDYIGEIASLNSRAMLILTGGEPLLRPDIFSLINEASRAGLTVFLGTNGTLIDDEAAGRLASAGTMGVGVSIDSAAADWHDRFRGVAGSWRAALSGIEALRRVGLAFQTQFTVTEENRGDIEDVIELSAGLGARAVNFFFLVCTGRARAVTDLDASAVEEILAALAEAEQKWRERIMVRARCAPQFMRVSSALDPMGPLLRGATAGCVAGTAYLRISPDGRVTPCPYMPVGEDSPSLNEKGLRDIWEEDESFIALRDGVSIGDCRACEFSGLCGGCRARALAEKGNFLAGDPACGHEPEGYSPVERPEPKWTPEARERLEKVPPFLREMVARGVGRYARSRGFSIITPSLMAELRSYRNGDGE